MKRNFCGFREYHLIREIKSSRKKTIFGGSGRLWPYQKLRFYLSDVSYINMNVENTRFRGWLYGDFNPVEISTRYTELKKNAIIWRISGLKIFQPGLKHNVFEKIENLEG